MKYVNGLLLKHPQTGEALTLNPDSRSGSFYDYLMECLNASATGFLSRLDAGISKQTYSVTDYLTGQHYRIRVGASDADTAFTVSMVLAVKLANAGYPVDYALVWDQSHSEADYPGEILK